MADTDLGVVLPGVALTDAATCARLGAVLAQFAGVAEMPAEPLIAPAMLLGRPQIAAATRAMTPPDGMGVVHESQMFRRADPLQMAGVADVTIRARIRPPSVVFDFELGAGAQAQMQTRLRFVTPQEMAALRGTRFSDRFTTGDTVWRASMPITAQAVAQYLALSHDPNPIHTSDGAARAVGLSGAVVPGMMLCGLAEAVLCDVHPGRWVREMKTRFMAAVPVGQAVRLAIVPRQRDADGALVMARIFAVMPGDVITAIMDVRTEGG
jgi:acyl dehydratase